MEELKKYLYKNNYVIVSILILLFIASLFGISFVWSGWYVLIYLYIATHASLYIFIISKTTFHLDGFAPMCCYLAIAILTGFAYIGFTLTDHDYITLETPSNQEILITATPLGIQLESKFKLYKKVGGFKQKLSESEQHCLWRTPFEKGLDEKKYYPYFKTFTINKLQFEWIDTNKLRIIGIEKDWLTQPIIFQIP